MRFSKMDKKITVKRRNTAETESGGIKEVGDPVEVFSDWARVQPVGGDKRLNYTQMGYTDPKEIFTSNRPEEVKPTDFVEFDGGVYEIISVFVTEDKKFIVMEVSK
ncbi:MAG: head-tail adaptor protein [Bacteroidales bacterium]|nr:head-tail adaptor protein [Bacteroidales bacterium]